MGLAAQKLESIYTYGDYLNWDDDERWELYEGIPVNMSPGPARRHQKLLGNLHGFFYNAQKNTSLKDCEIYMAPFDVRLPQKDEADENIITVLQPDLIIVCDKNKLDDRGMRGAPDILFEILSPSTASRDQGIKRDLYEKHGVAEYWILDPVGQSAMVYLLQNGSYGKPIVFSMENNPHLFMFNEVIIPLGELFAEL